VTQSLSHSVTQSLSHFFPKNPVNPTNPLNPGTPFPHHVRNLKKTAKSHPGTDTIDELSIEKK
ncbi:MAG: hypothetical protein JW915_20240, partial [Chitinispirillaceae bacterium]|nr:hypothetical protein [Chitinispirillaceae bacterium]